MTIYNALKTISRLLIGLIGVTISLYVGYFAVHPINEKVLAYCAAGLLVSGIIIDADPIVGAIGKLIGLAKSAKDGNVIQLPPNG